MEILIIDNNEQYERLLCDNIRKLVKSDEVLMSKNISVKYKKIWAESVLDIEEGKLFPDILFMDVDLGPAHKNGIQVAANIKRILPDVQIIFISAYDDYYLDVYEVEHVYFLKKPMDRESLSKAIYKAMEKVHSDEGKYFTYEIDRKKFLVPYSSIRYMESDNIKVTVYMEDGTDATFYAVLGRVYETLGDNFLRCHNSFIVNMDKVTAFKRDSFLLGDKVIPISRSYRNDAKAAFAQRIDSCMLQED